MEQQIWKEEFFARKKEKRNWATNNPAIYNLLLTYCTLAMKNKLEGMDGYEKIKKDQDGIGLRQELQKVMQQRDGTKGKMVSIVGLDKKLFCLWQGKEQSLESYLSAHIGLVDAIKATGGAPGYSLAAARVVAEEENIKYDAI